jgi:hypothetical protein
LSDIAVIRVPKLALDDVERQALARELDSRPSAATAQSLRSAASTTPGDAAAALARAMAGERFTAGVDRSVQAEQRRRIELERALGKKPYQL